jgi:hypothetical protein
MGKGGPDGRTRDVTAPGVTIADEVVADVAVRGRDALNLSASLYAA